MVKCGVESFPAIEVKKGVGVVSACKWLVLYEQNPIMRNIEYILIDLIDGTYTRQ